MRLPRIIGIDNALRNHRNWRGTKPAAALKVGMVDAVVAADQIEASAIDLVKKCIAGDLDWKARHDEKSIQSN